MRLSFKVPVLAAQGRQDRFRRGRDSPHISASLRSLCSLAPTTLTHLYSPPLPPNSTRTQILVIPMVTATCDVNVSAARSVYAFSRDGGLPYSSLLGRVHKGLDVPLHATAVVFAVQMPLAFIYIVSVKREMRNRRTRILSPVLTAFNWAYLQKGQHRRLQRVHVSSISYGAIAVFNSVSDRPLTFCLRSLPVIQNHIHMEKKPHPQFNARHRPQHRLRHSVSADAVLATTTTRGRT